MVILGYRSQNSRENLFKEPLMQIGIMALLIGSAMVFASPAFSTEMIRYEHEIYTGSSGDQVRYEAPKDEQYLEHQREQNRRVKATKDKEGHPIFIAFSNRN
jgi:hypothetical protein